MCHLCIYRGVIDRLCELVELTGSADAWWDAPVGTLIQNDELASQYEKGKVRMKPISQHWIIWKNKLCQFTFDIR